MTLIKYRPWNLLNKFQKELEWSQDSKCDEGIMATAKKTSTMYTHQADKVAMLGEIADALKTNKKANILTLKGKKESVGLALLERLRLKIL
ncbi:hypothetical protein [Crenothrix sp.]|uniref:hypothetical protein n=1 Tax=Crenothrix sp. TaxID=3100433 RepID=UPI00374D275D